MHSNTTISATKKNNLTNLPTSPQPQTAREVVQANVQLLIEQLEAGHSEALTHYLTAMERFHTYFPPCRSVTTTNRTATPCATRRCALS